MQNFRDITDVIEKVRYFTHQKITLIIIVLALIIIAITGLYTVNPEEVGVIQRFGKYVTTNQPGLHFKIPFGVDKLTKVKVKHVYKEEFGFRTVKPGVKSSFSSKSFFI